MLYSPPTSDDRGIWDLWLTQTYQGTVVAADEAGIFTTLENAPAGIPELATRLGFDQRATSIVVRLLAALGLLVPREPFNLVRVVAPQSATCCGSAHVSGRETSNSMGCKR